MSGCIERGGNIDFCFALLNKMRCGIVYHAKPEVGRGFLKILHGTVTRTAHLYEYEQCNIRYRNPLMILIYRSSRQRRLRLLQSILAILGVSAGSHNAVLSRISSVPLNPRSWKGAPGAVDGGEAFRDLFGFTKSNINMPITIRRRNKRIFRFVDLR